MNTSDITDQTEELPSQKGADDNSEKKISSKEMNGPYDDEGNSVVNAINLTEEYLPSTRHLSKSCVTFGPSPIQPRTAKLTDQLMIRDLVFSILNFRSRTKAWFNDNDVSIEEFLSLSSEVIKDTCYEKDGFQHAMFNQSEQDRLILLSRWMDCNKDDLQDVKWENFNRNSLNNFVSTDVSQDILDEILAELKIPEEVRDTLKDYGVHTPALFVGRSKYWYEHEIGLHSAAIHEFGKFKSWYKYQMDTYLPSDWIEAYRKESGQLNDLEWRRVLIVIGLKPDAVLALEINGVCNIGSLNQKSKVWRVTEPVTTSTCCGRQNTQVMEKWDEWKKMGLKETDARNIINFRHWHVYFVAGRKSMNGWQAEFNHSQYNNYVEQYIDPNKIDEFKKPGWLASKTNDKLKLSQERSACFNILQKATEDGNMTEGQRYHLKKHYEERREKMELIEEIREGQGDVSFQEKRLNDMFEKENSEENEKSVQELLFFQKYYQFFFSTLVVYALLLAWVGTTTYFMAQWILEKRQIDSTKTDLLNNVGAADYATFIHNIVFGLVTAVIIQELGEESKHSVYNRFLETYRERWYRSKERRLMKHLLDRRRPFHRYMSRLMEFCDDTMVRLILNSTRVYILVWIILGVASLAFGAINAVDSSNPLYTTGQTWLGIAVTIGYSYFGLNEKMKRVVNSKRGNIAAQADNDGDDSTNSGDAMFTDEKGEERVLKTHQDLMDEIDHYDRLLSGLDDDNCYEAAGDRRRYSYCMSQLDKLKEKLPTHEHLRSQLEEAEAKMKAAAEKQEFGNAERHKKVVSQLKKKLKGEKDAEARRDISSVKL